MGTVYGLRGGCWWRREGEARPALLEFEQAVAAAMAMGRRPERLHGEGESCERLGRVADDLQRLGGGLYIAGAKRGGGGMRRAMCPCAGEGAASVDTAKAHGEWREGDEEGADGR